MATRSHDVRDDDADGGVGRQDVFEDLFAALAGARSGAHPHRMATHLLRRADGQRRLVALVDGGRQAVFHEVKDARDARNGVLTATPFDEHGLVDERTVGLLTEAGPATWVARNRGTLAWVHPRYRTERADGGERTGQGG